MVDITATSKPEIPMYHSGKYQTVTPRPVRIVQNESCNCLSKVVIGKGMQSTYAKVDISDRIKERRPREAAVEHLTDGLVLFLLKDCVRDTLFVSTVCQQIVPLHERDDMERAARTSYFGSRRTYPLLRPLTSLTTISKPLKSTAVTASKATSRRTRDHSKKA